MCSKSFLANVLFAIFYVYTILVYIHHIHHWMQTHKVTEEVKPTTVNRETQIKFVMLFKELFMAINHHTIELAVKLSVMGVQRHSSKRHLTIKC